jgi:hypothetical protein
MPTQNELAQLPDVNLEYILAAVTQAANVKYGLSFQVHFLVEELIRIMQILSWFENGSISAIHTTWAHAISTIPHGWPFQNTSV